MALLKQGWQIHVPSVPLGKFWEIGVKKMKGRPGGAQTTPCICHGALLDQTAVIGIAFLLATKVNMDLPLSIWPSHLKRPHKVHEFRARSGFDAHPCAPLGLTGSGSFSSSLPAEEVAKCVTDDD